MGWTATALVRVCGLMGGVLLAPGVAAENQDLEYDPPWLIQAGVQEDNDIFGLDPPSDIQNTQSLRFHVFWRRSEARTDDDGGTFPDGNPNRDTGSPLLGPLRWLYSTEDNDLTFTNGFVFAQSIYTPIKVTRTVVIPDDRPYAGWLHGGLITRVTSDLLEKLPWQDTFELDLGVVGPSALGDEVQSEVHRWIKDDNPTWVGQLPDEFAILLAWDRRWMKSIWGDPEEENSWRAFVSPQVALRLGNVFTDIGLGTRLLAGWNTPYDFGAGRVNPSILADHPRFSLYAFAGVEARAVAHNIFLDGTVFRTSNSVDRNDLVAEFVFGFSVRWAWLSISVAQVFGTPEIETESRFHNYGMFQVSVLWGG